MADIVIRWRAPMPDPVPGMLHDPGGFIYRIFRNGQLVVSGSYRGTDIEDVRAFAIRRAAENGILSPSVDAESRP